MNFRQNCFVITCIVLSIRHSSQAQSYSRNCDQLWAYSSDYKGYYGLIRITQPDSRSSNLRVVLSVAVRLAPQSVGSLKLTKSIESSVADISRGLPLFYRVDFPIQNPVPSIGEIYYNNRLLCSAPKVTGTYVATITLNHNLKTGLTQQSPVQRIIPTVTTRKPQTARPTARYTTRYTTQPPRRVTTTQPPRRVTTTQRTFVPAVKVDDNQCGIPDYKAPITTPLIIRGMDVDEGQFPWLAALYYSPQNSESSFICGGSLISRKLVVTAAHCIHRKGDAIKAKPEEFLFYFGKRNLQTTDSEVGQIVSAVTNVFVHPDWDYRMPEYDADISITVLQRTIVFNQKVKPICLWTSTNSYDDLVGMKGVVAGWGVDENKNVATAKPKWASISVVTSESCLRSHSSFIALTSRRTFCAGDSLPTRIGGSSPCNGDSGGGFVFQSGKKWYLRGIISAGLLDQETGNCNPKTFTVFTDATKFTSWIQKYIALYG